MRKRNGVLRETERKLGGGDRDTEKGWEEETDGETERDRRRRWRRERWREQ